MATGNANKKIIQGLSKDWLSPREIAFIDDFFETGMQCVWMSYQKAFGCSKSTAEKIAYRILRKQNVKNEITARINASRVTNDWVLDKGITFVEKGVKDCKFSLAGQKSLEMLAKHKGMLEDTVNHKFSGENPAVFVPLYSKEEAEQLAKSGRVQE